MNAVQEKAKEIVHTVEHPLAVAKQLEHEADEGESARTPLIALVGVMLVVTAIFVVMMALAMTLYFVYGGK